MSILHTLFSLLLMFTITSCSTAQSQLSSCSSKDQKHSVPELTINQELVIASFELEIDRVKELLESQANPNARLGFYNKYLFEDNWKFGLSPYESVYWTPLIAVASSHRAPQPDKQFRNTETGRRLADEGYAKIDPQEILKRDQRRVAIAKLLIKANAYLNLDDTYGTTALATSTYRCYDELSLLLIASGANINTKTIQYAHIHGDITPLHRATSSPKVLAAMLKKGALVNVVNTYGKTPLHYAVLDGNIQSVKLLIDAGADVSVRDIDGRTPAYWSKTSEFLSSAENDKRKEIATLFSKTVLK